MKSVKKFFVSKRKLSLALLYLADILINKPKTELNVFNYVVFLTAEKLVRRLPRPSRSLHFGEISGDERLGDSLGPHDPKRIGPRAIMRPRDQQSPTLAFG